MRTPGLLLLLVLTATACGVGDDSTEPPPSTPEPRLCLSNFEIAGTFTLGAPVPDEVNNETGQPPGDGMPDFSGCWPTGTWTFTLTMLDNTCPTPPAPAASYSFRTDYMLDPQGDPRYMYTVLAPTPGPADKVKVSSGGGGLCEAGMELFSADGTKTWNLHPALNTFNGNGPLTGQGEYAEWEDSQIPTPAP